MRPSTLALAGLALVLQTPAGVSAETLADAIALAYRSNPTLQSGRSDVRAADEDIVQARSEMRPTSDLRVTGRYDRTVEGRATARAYLFSPRRSTNTNKAQIAIVEPLYTGGKATADR